jgi:hypothetical protein
MGQVGPPVAVPTGSDPLGPTAHYFEPVVAVSAANGKEVIAGAILYDATQGTTNIHYGVSLDGATTFATGVLTGANACLPSGMGDPFVASSVATGDMWIGGLLSATPSLPGFAIARRPAGKLVLDPTSYPLCVPDLLLRDKGWLAVGPRPPGYSPGESLYIGFQLTYDGSCGFDSGHLANIRSDDASSWFAEDLIQPPAPHADCLYRGNGVAQVVLQSGLKSGRVVASYSPNDGNWHTPRVSVSDDLGQSWSSEVSLDNGGLIQVAPDDGSWGFANVPYSSIALDRGSPGFIYVAYPAVGTNPSTSDLIIGLSTDNGDNFTQIYR